MYIFYILYTLLYYDVYIGKKYNSYDDYKAN